MDTSRCIIENLKQDDYDDVKLLYFNDKVREFLGGIISDERYKGTFKEMISNKEDSLYLIVRLKYTNDFVDRYKQFNLTAPKSKKFTRKFQHTSKFYILAF